MHRHPHVSSFVLAALLTLTVSAARGQTAFLGIEPAEPAPGDEVIASVWRTAGTFDPAVVPKLYVGYAFTSNGPFTPLPAPLPPQAYDPAAPDYFRVSLGRLSRLWVNVRYYHAADPDLSRPPDAIATFEVKERRAAYVRVIEYFDAARDHYFMTADAAEIARLDSGATPGWQRTGESFVAFEARRAQANLGSPVCRFYGRPEFGLDSHFFAAWPAECAAVRVKWPAQWQLESEDVFEFVDDFSCGDDGASQPLYRVYNGRPDVNHRYVLSRALRDRMVAGGWIAEGTGPDIRAGCVYPDGYHGDSVLR